MKCSDLLSTPWLIFFIISSLFTGCSSINKSVARDNDDPIMMVYLYSSLGKNNLAVKEIDQLLDKNPSDKKLNLTCIYFCLKANHYEKAYEIIQKYMDNYEPNYEFYHLRGMILFKNGDINNNKRYDQALLDFDRGIELIQKSTDSSINEKYLFDLSAKVINYKKSLEKNNCFKVNGAETNIIFRDYEKDHKHLVHTKKIYDINKACIDMLNMRAYIYIRKGEYQKADNDYELAFTIEPGNTKTHLGKASLERKRGNYENMLTQYSKALEYETDNPNLYKLRGKANIEVKDYQKAYNDFTEARLKNPDDKTNILGQARSLYGLKKCKQSVEVVSEFVSFKRKLDPDLLLQGYHLRAASYVYLKHYDSAIKDYTEILKISPYNKDARFQRGIVYNFLKNPAAIEDLQHIAQGEPDNYNVFCELAIAYMHKSNFSYAEKLLKKTIKINPSYYRSYGNLGYLYYRTKSSDRWILSCLDKSINLNPDYIPSYFYKSLFYRDRKDYETAIEELDKILELRKNMYKAHFYKAIIYEFLKDRDNAVNEYKKTVKYAPEESDVTTKFAKERIKILSSNVALNNIEPEHTLKLGDFSQKIDINETNEPVTFQFVVSQRFYPAEVTDAGSEVKVSYQEITNEYGEKEYKYAPEEKTKNTNLDSKEHINDFRKDIVNLITGDKIEGLIVNESYNVNPDKNILVFDIPQKNLKLLINDIKSYGKAQTLLGPFANQMEKINHRLDSNDLMRIRITLDISKDITK